MSKRRTAASRIAEQHLADGKALVEWLVRPAVGCTCNATIEWVDGALPAFVIRTHEDGCAGTNEKVVTIHSHGGDPAWTAEQDRRRARAVEQWKENR